MRRRRILTLLAATALLIVCGGGSYLYLSGRLDWPFALRYSDGAFDDPQLYPKLLPALWAIMGALMAGGALIFIGLLGRRLRSWLVAAGAAVIVGLLFYFLPTLKPLTVEAFPTTYYRSPTGYSAASIVQGAAHYATHCAACHGRGGRGDGPGGRFLRVKPSDLTADHVYGHTDGDMYWWISNGIGDVMPDFRAALSEQARWNVIDFVRANADAVRLSQTPAKVTNVGYRAPDFSAPCTGNSRLEPGGLRGRIVHLVVLAKPERWRALLTQHRGSAVVLINIEPTGQTAICRSSFDELIKVLALYRGGGPIEGAEFLLDGAGLIRAAWSPGGRPNWSIPDELEREIAAIRNNPPASRPRGSHPHGR